MAREAKNAFATAQHLRDTLFFDVLPMVTRLTARFYEREQQEREKEQDDVLCSDTLRQNRITIHP